LLSVLVVAVDQMVVQVVVVVPRSRLPVMQWQQVMYWRQQSVLAELVVRIQLRAYRQQVETLLSPEVQMLLQQQEVARVEVEDLVWLAVQAAHPQTDSPVEQQVQVLRQTVSQVQPAKPVHRTTSSVMPLNMEAAVAVADTTLARSSWLLQQVLVEAVQVVVHSLPQQTPTPPQEYVAEAEVQAAPGATDLDAQMVLTEAMVLSLFDTQQMCWMHSQHRLLACKAVT
jgi:hypothetical protein